MIEKKNYYGIDLLKFIMAVCVVAIHTQPLYSVQSIVVQRLEKFKYIAIRNSLVRIVGIILLFLLVKNQNDLWIYLLIIGVSQMLGNVSMWPYLRGNLCGVKLSVKGVTHHFKEVLIYFIPSVTYQIYAVLDKAIGV